MNEVQAAFGLLQLKYIDKAIERRREIDAQYREKLLLVTGIICPPIPDNTDYNHSYYPIVIEKDYPLSREDLYQKLRANNVYARRYFYPLISEFSMYRGLPSASHHNLPVAAEIASKVLCLPIYPNLSNEQITFIIDLIKGTI